MSLSAYGAQALLNAYFGNTSNFGTLSSRPTLYIGLSQTLPTAAGGNITEPTGGGYARVVANPADWGDATLAIPSEIKNVNAIVFAPATADWLGGANLAYAVFFDALTAGNFLKHGTLTTAKAVQNGDTARFPADQITVALA